jgi:hypothetical protein
VEEDPNGVPPPEVTVTAPDVPPPLIAPEPTVTAPVSADGSPPATAATPDVRVTGPVSAPPEVFPVLIVISADSLPDVSPSKPAPVIFSEVPSVVTSTPAANSGVASSAELPTTTKSSAETVVLAVPVVESVRAAPTTVKFEADVESRLMDSGPLTSRALPPAVTIVLPPS